MNLPIAFNPVSTLARQLRNGDISAVELFDCFVERINRLGADSKAFISLDLEQARSKLEGMQVSEGDSPFKAIPYACKDLFDVKGIATTGGSRVLEDNIATRDAEVITRMNNIGAIFLGKNNLHEFAYGATGENQIFGTPPNPYDTSRLAGGSSSGSAAALGYGLCAAALGTDTGGSVRAPAALCGLVGFKPTFGRISTEGVLPYSWSLDHVGSFTRSAADAALLFEGLATQHQSVPSVSMEGQVIGIPEAFFYEHCDSEILDQIDALRAFLASAGASIVKVSMPSMATTRTVSLTIQMPEALSYHSRYLEQRGHLYSQDFRAGLALGQCLLAEQYIRARRFLESYRRDMAGVFSKVDMILTPATPVTAPLIGAVDVSVDGISEPAGNAITRYTSFFNMTGHPAITFPCGLDSKGLPISAQLVGRHHEDEQLLALTAELETQRKLEPCLPPAFAQPDQG